MTSTNMKRFIIGVGIVAMMLCAIAMVWSDRSALARLQQDRLELSELNRMLQEIETVAAAPRVAALELESSNQILDRINAALEQSGLSPELLASQTPGQPQRIGQSEFKLRRIEIKLNQASVMQITSFCDALRDATTGSVVRDLQLYEPRQSGSDETWNSQLTLTQVIFSPKSDM